MMFEINQEGKTFTMGNETLFTMVDYGRGEITEFSTLFAGKKQNRNRPLFLLKIYGKIYSCADFILASVSWGKDKTQDLVSLQYELDREQLKVRVHFLNNRTDTIQLIYQVWDGYKLGVPYNSRMKIPLLSELEVNGPGDRFYPPGNPVVSLQEKPVIQPPRDYEYSSDIQLPLVVCDKEDKTGFMVRLPSLSDLNDDGANQNANKGLCRAGTEREIRDDFFRINPDASFNDTFEAVFTGIRNGWVEAFDRYRGIWAQAYDFSEYRKEDLRWFKTCVIHNFTFLFGKEGFNHETGRIDVEKLLEQGKAFGGYDTVTLWNQYPRLGIDGRTQWDFYDDFPGGRAALREAVEEFHKHGVRVFLPYIPWDRGPRENTETMGDAFARLIADTGADGYQLDTMHDIPRSFREKLDALRPGLILTSQSHPSKGLPLEIVTTSWDEFWRADPMPEVDLLRFICPIHLAPVISRWSRYEDKTILIKRAIFSAVPIVIWQDIFGRRLPFGEDQKALLRSYKEVYLKYRPIYQGGRPIPLYPLPSHPDLYCNLFSGDREPEEIYSFYNHRDQEIDAGGIRLHRPRHTRSRVVFGEGTAEIEGETLRIRGPAREVIHVLLS
ncbi:MAG: hypothetical protein LBC60_00355 [Spirochaetaceae bacterium]|jgi:hypothetical protein|nr:hypothetical protein [Spirochaetaceae bacterium]